MLDKIDHDIVKGFITKVYQNFKLNLDTIQVNEEVDNVNYRAIHRFQVTHKTKESEGIEWRFVTTDFDFKYQGLYRLLNDNHFDALFKELDRQLFKSKPYDKMSARLDARNNEQLVL